MDAMLSYYAMSLQKVYKFAYLQILWILFTVLGMGLLGVFPATYALFTVLNEHEDLTAKRTFRLFYQTYSSSFIKINKAGLIWQVMFLLISINLFIPQVENFQVIVFAMLCLIMLCIVYFFRYFEQEQPIIKQIKYCFRYVCLHPKQNFMYMIIFFGLFLAINFIPGITFFFGMSVAAYLIVKT